MTCSNAKRCAVHIPVQA